MVELMAYGFGHLWLWLWSLMAYRAFRAYREDAITMDAIRRVVIVITVA
jgi:hypothetical protein